PLRLLLLLLCRSRLALSLRAVSDSFWIVLVHDVVLRVAQRLVGESIICEGKKLQLHTCGHVDLSASLASEVRSVATICMLAVHGHALKGNETDATTSAAAA